MRLFLAIELPKEAKDYLFDLKKEIKDAKVTWVSKKNLHLTLKFLGDVDEKKLPELKRKLQINAEKIHASLGTLGFFPDEKSPKVFWVSIEPEEDIINLQQQLDAELLTDFPGEQKFRAHVTLGRIKLIRKKQEFLKSVREIRVKKIPIVIDSFKLIKSELKKTGPVYEIIDDVSLS